MTSAVGPDRGRQKAKRKRNGPIQNRSAWVTFVDMKLVLATQNPYKITELTKALPSHWELISAKAMGMTEDIPETGDSLAANALIKARAIHERFGLPAMSDDTGLEVMSLDGEPGVHSARYAGPSCDDKANRVKLLKALSKHSDRRAQFRTVVALVDGEGEHLFEGVARGIILEKEQGEGGFGYDALFQSDDLPNRSFAEVSLEEKNAVSHRGKAVREFIAFMHHA